MPEQVPSPPTQDQYHRWHTYILVNRFQEADFLNEKTGPYLEKYIMRHPDIPAEHQHRAFRLFQDMMSSAWGGHKLIDALHGGGSPVIEKVAIYRDADLEHSKNIAKKLGGTPFEGSTKKLSRKFPWL